MTPSAIQVIPDEGILKAKANFNESTYIPIFYRGTKNIRVQYQAGYSDYPSDIFEAVCRLTAEQALVVRRGMPEIKTCCDHSRKVTSQRSQDDASILVR